MGNIIGVSAIVALGSTKGVVLLTEEITENKWLIRLSKGWMIAMWFGVFYGQFVAK